MTVDTNYVLNGTDQKRFNNARAELEHEYNESTAHDFFYEYNNRPLSFLLRNSRNIFSESYYGLDFYRNLLEKQIINPLHYETELEKVKAFINEAKAKRLPTDQIQKYIELAKFLEEKCHRHHHLAHVFKRAHTFPGVEDYYNQFFDLLNDPHKDYSTQLAEEIFHSNKDPQVSIPIGYCLCVKHPNYCPYLMNISTTSPKLVDEDSIGRREKQRLCVREMMQDEAVRQNTSSFPNINLYPTWVQYATTEQYPMPKQQPVTESSDRNIMLAANTVEAIFESFNDTELIGKANINKYDHLRKSHAVLSAYEDYILEEVMMGERKETDKTISYMEDAFQQTELGIACLEWEADGSPNAVIQQHIMTTKEREAEASKREAEKNAMRSEEDTLSVIADARREMKALDREKISDAEKSKRASDLKSELDADLHREVNTYPEAKSAMDDLDDFMNDLDFNEAGEEEEEPSDRDPNAKKPQKPKEDIATKVQNKALDADAKMTQKEAQIDEKAQKFKNAGNAVSQHPKKLAAGIDQTIQDFDKWDDNRRKKFLLKPGYRHKIFKKFLAVLEYGAAAKISAAAIPMLWTIRHLSKQKDKRIRNELSLELDNEIKICEEKINDASSAGDTQKKYQLMRIKDKLEAERTRVRLNSKYV